MLTYCLLIALWLPIFEYYALFSKSGNNFFNIGPQTKRLLKGLHIFWIVLPWHMLGLFYLPWQMHVLFYPNICMDCFTLIYGWVVLPWQMHGLFYLDICLDCFTLTYAWTVLPWHKWWRYGCGQSKYSDQVVQSLMYSTKLLQQLLILVCNFIMKTVNTKSAIARCTLYWYLYVSIINMSTNHISIANLIMH